MPLMLRARERFAIQAINRAVALVGASGVRRARVVAMAARGGGRRQWPGGCRRCQSAPRCGRGRWACRRRGSGAAAARRAGRRAGWWHCGPRPMVADIALDVGYKPETDCPRSCKRPVGVIPDTCRRSSELTAESKSWQSLQCTLQNWPASRFPCRLLVLIGPLGLGWCSPGFFSRVSTGYIPSANVVASQ